MGIFGDSDGSAERRAHEIAREIVADELLSIDRMHSRAMRYITAYTSVMALLFIGLGWLGYERLQGIVLDATMKNVQAQTLQRVNHQVDEDLNHLGVQNLISNKVADFATSDLRGALTEQIEHGPVHDEIRRIAFATSAGNRSPVVQSGGAGAQVSTASIPSGRTLTDDQQNRFRSIISQRRDPSLLISPGMSEESRLAISGQVLIYVLPDNAEALTYAKQIKSLLKTIGWDADVVQDSLVATADDRRLASGVHLIYNPNVRYYHSWERKANETVSALFSCLLQAGIPAFTSTLPSTMKRDSGSFIAVGAQR